MEHSSFTYDSVSRAFSKQAPQFDQLDSENPILQDLRNQVYDHVNRIIKPAASILELNAGTGIDAFHFANLGHTVLATDVSPGMIEVLQQKMEAAGAEKISCRQLSYDSLSAIQETNFDFVFSNFGGLNCIDDLHKVTRQLPGLLRKNAKVTFVIMPCVCPAELASALKGNFGFAFRRFKKGGTIAHLEGEYFQTYYHSLGSIKKAFGERFTLIAAEGLAALSPQPHSARFANKFSTLYRFSRRVDKIFRHSFPFNRWADHIIVTFQFQG